MGEAPEEMPTAECLQARDPKKEKMTSSARRIAQPDRRDLARRVGPRGRPGASDESAIAGGEGGGAAARRRGGGGGAMAARVPFGRLPARLQSRISTSVKVPRAWSAQRRPKPRELRMTHLP